MENAEGSHAERAATAVLAAEEIEVLPDLHAAFPGLERAGADWIARMSEAGVLRTVVACEKAIARTQAVQMRALARLGQLGESERSIAAEVALAVASTEGRAQNQLALAETLTTRLPGTLAAMESGTLDAHKASKVADATAVLDDADAREADRILAPRLAGKNPSSLRQAASRVATRLDPESAARRAAEQRRERKVELIHRPDGMASLVADLPAETASAIYSRLDRIARSMRGEGEPRNLDQLRADALAGLCLSSNDNSIAEATGESAGSAAGRPRAEVFVYLSAESLAGLTDEPGELSGHGPIPAALARHIAYQPNSTWRRILTDPAGGQILDVGRTRYRAPRALDELVRVRDRTCRHPGCHRPTWAGDLDHHQQWARDRGSTTAVNLIGYCRKHHRLKDEPDWEHHLAEDGTLTVTTPTGRSYTSTPDDPPF